VFDPQVLIGSLLARLLLFLFEHPVIGLLSVWLVFASSARSEGDEKKAEMFTLFALPSVLPMLSALALPFVASGLLHTRWTPGAFNLIAWALCFGAGIAAGVYWHRVWVPRIDAMQARFTKKTRLERNKRTDVREIHKFLPAEIGGYDPARYIKEDKGLFICPASTIVSG